MCKMHSFPLQLLTKKEKERINIRSFSVYLLDSDYLPNNTALAESVAGSNV